MQLPEFNEKGERMVLGHDPVPPYSGVFWTTFLLGLAYLAVVFVMTMNHAGPAH